jgi:uncharacterized protein
VSLNLKELPQLCTPCDSWHPKHTHQLGRDRHQHFALDPAQIEGFDWDEGNNRKSVENHDVSQAEAEQIFFNDPLLVVEDVSHSARELRLQALGRTDAGRLLHISFTLRGDGKLIRVISARTMHRKERLRYEHES